MEKIERGNVKMNEQNLDGSKELTIKIRKDQMWKYSTFILAAVLIVVAFFYFSAGKGTPTANVVNNPGQQVPTAAAQVTASADNDAVEGNKNAPVTIIEFSDYQCPFCRKFFTETLPSIRKDYVEKGKVKIVFRDFPLSSLHPMAEKSAEAAECVREKGGDKAYFKFHDKMFQEQNILDSGSAMGAVTKTATYTNDDLKKWAKDLGYDISSCLDTGKFASEVAKDAADAQAAGGQGTPYFVINGKALSGAYPYDSFKQIIDAELAK